MEAPFTEAIEQQTPEPIQDEYGDDGVFYSNLVKIGHDWMAKSAMFGRAALDEIGGGYIAGLSTSLKSTSDDATDINQPVSVFQRVIDTYLPALAPEDLDVTVDPKREDARFDATIQGIRCEMLMDEVQFEEVDREAVMQALCTGYGVRLVLPAYHIFQLIANEDIDEGTPTVWNVSVTDGDFACDPEARSHREDRFRAVRIRVSSRLAVRLGFMTQEQVNKCEKHTTTSDNTCDLIYLWVVCVYERTQIRWGILYRPGFEEWFEPLQLWDGHPDGPIEVTAIKPFRVKNRQVTPLHQLAELHKATSRVAEALVRRGILEKSVIATNESAEEWVAQLISTPHMGVINTAGTATPITMGGMTPGHIELSRYLNDQTNNSSANLQQSSGNKGISDTAREAMILQNNAQRMLKDMADACKRSRDRIASRLMYYDYYGQQAANGLSMSVPVTTPMGTSLQAVNVAPQDREADFFDLTFKVSSSTARDMDPAVKLDLLTQLSQVLPTAIATIAQLGGNPDPLVRDFAELSGLHSLTEMFPTPSGQLIMQAKQQEAQQAQMEGQQDQAKKEGGGGDPMTEMGAMGKLTPMVNQPVAGGVA